MRRKLYLKACIPALLAAFLAAVVPYQARSQAPEDQRAEIAALKADLDASRECSRANPTR
jgi:hypothetical protein